jgi:hypothetical protein
MPPFSAKASSRNNIGPLVGTADSTVSGPDAFDHAREGGNPAMACIF